MAEIKDTEIVAKGPHTLRYVAKGSQFTREGPDSVSEPFLLTIAHHFAPDYKEFEG